jgi:hypothetical protein
LASVNLASAVLVRLGELDAETRTLAQMLALHEGALTAEERIRFYEFLAHNLTISVRGIWSDENFTDSQKIEGMKCVNEIMHRVVKIPSALKSGHDMWSEADTCGTIEHWVSLSPEIGEHVWWAIKESYESCRR